MGPWLHRHIGVDFYYKEMRRYSHFREWFRTGSRGLVERLRREPGTMSEFIEPDAVRRYAEDYLAGREDNWRILGGLTTLFDLREVFRL